MAVVEFQCCTFSLCYVDMALDMPVKILYNTIKNKHALNTFSESPSPCTVLTTIMMSRAGLFESRLLLTQD